MPTRTHRPERLSFPGVTRSLPIHAQPADGTVDHDVALDDLDGGPIGIGHRLDPIEDEAHHAVGSCRRKGIDQALGLDDVVQQFELGVIARESPLLDNRKTPGDS